MANIQTPSVFNTFYRIINASRFTNITYGEDQIILSSYDINTDKNKSEGFEDYTELDYQPHSLESIFEFIVRGILMNIIGILGIIGNTVSMVIFSRPQMKSSTCVLLFSIAFFDVVFDVFAILYAGLTAIYPYTGTTFMFYYIYEPKIDAYLLVLLESAFTSSSYLTVALSFERFTAVYFPLHVKTICTRRKAKMCVFVITILSFIFNIPKFWRVKIIYREYTENNTTLILNITRLHLYISMVYVYIEAIVDVIPFVCCLLLNILIYRKSKQIRKGRQKLGLTQISDINTTKILLFGVQGFLVCNFFKFCWFFCNIDNNWTLAGVRWPLMVLNNLVNVIIYATLWKNYQNMFLTIFYYPACALTN